MKLVHAVEMLISVNIMKINIKKENVKWSLLCTSNVLELKLKLIKLSVAFLPKHY